VTQRLALARVAPDAYRAMYALQQYVTSAGIDHQLLHLVYLRASYINGCAYCVDMHTKDARAAGETEQRLYSVPVWRETPFYSPQERAALAYTEAVTLIGAAGVPDDVYDEAREYFDEGALVGLTMAIITINGWNRLAVALGADVGSYQPRRPAAAAAAAAAAPKAISPDHH
jgi:AhpD family alkylhydroperoxidase